VGVSLPQAIHENLKGSVTLDLIQDSGPLFVPGRAENGWIVEFWDRSRSVFNKPT